MTDTYTQCRLTRDGETQIAWIPTRGAKVNARVEVKPENDLWLVEETYDELPEEVVRDNERNFKNHRKATDI